MFDMLRIYYVNILENCDGNMYLPILHLPRVELSRKLQEKLHRVTRSLQRSTCQYFLPEKVKCEG